MNLKQSRLYRDISYLFSCLRHPRAVRGYYFAWTGHSNLGDDALQKAIYAMFRGKAVFHDDYKGKLGRMLSSMPIFRTDFVMMGGGTHILENDHELDRMSYPEVSKRAIFGTGVSDHIFLKEMMKTPVPEEKWRGILDKTDYIGVRGPISLKTLRAIGVKKEAKVIGDPVLYYAREIREPKKMKKRLGINFGHVENKMWGRGEDALLERFAEFLKVMLADGWDIEIVPTWGAVDLSAIHKVIEKAGAAGKIPVFGGHDSLTKVLDRLETFDVFLGLRLHAVVFAYCATTPGIMIDYRTKGADFMESIGMGELTIRTDEFSAQKAKERVEKVYGDLENYRKKSNRACLEIREDLLREAKVLLDILKK